MSSIVKAGLPPRPSVPATMPPIRYAAAAAAAVAPMTAPPASASQMPVSVPLPNTPIAPGAPSIPLPPPPSTLQPADQQSRAPSSPSLTHPSVTSPILSSASASNQPDGSFYSGQESPALSEVVPSSVGAPAATSSPQRKGATYHHKVGLIYYSFRLCLSSPT